METWSEIGDVAKTDFNGFTDIIYLKDEWLYLYSILYILYILYTVECMPYGVLKYNIILL